MPDRDLLRVLSRAGVLTPLDRHFALSLRKLEPATSRLTLLAAALASRAVTQGHVCVRLSSIVTTPLLDGEQRPVDGFSWPELEPWLDELANSPLCGDGSEPRPLILNQRDHLYLYRYFDLERRLEQNLRGRLGSMTIDQQRLSSGLRRLFAAAPPEGLSAELASCLIASLSSRFTLISGGPGTGKTTAVARILVLLRELSSAGAGAAGAGPTTNGSPRVLLLAPTGKAAQRLSSALARSLEELARVTPEFQHCAAEASTIHRALGYRTRTPTHFAHDSRRPLAVDVVVVDEASMVDLALLTRLLEAIPNDARVILLGDKDQLASVEAGSVFGDIYGTASQLPRSAELRQRVAQLTQRALDPAAGFTPNPLTSPPPPAVEAAVTATTAPGQALRDSIVELTHSYRYPASSGIGKLARAINAGDAAAALDLLSNAEEGLAFHELDQQGSALERQLGSVLEPLFMQHYRPYAEARDAGEKLERLDRFRILTALRKGAFGADSLNRQTEQALQALGLTPATDLYDGQPVMVTHNDHELGLYNGDVGVVGRDQRGNRRVWFRVGQELSPVLPSHLPAHETVFAMTIHKSQGSEFDEVLVVLPPPSSRILSRELLYTAITRAKRRLTVIGPRASVRLAIERRVERHSGLTHRLWAAR